jgi:uncharacterized membrane protein
MATGRPTLLGWRGHEMQWRGRRYGALAGWRDDAARQIYSGDGDLSTLLHQSQVDYVALGPRERQLYGDRASDRLARSMDLAFAEGEWLLFRRRG